VIWRAQFNSAGNRQESRAELPSKVWASATYTLYDDTTAVVINTIDNVTTWIIHSSSWPIGQ
jgi:hypothetical protein